MNRFSSLIPLFACSILVFLPTSGCEEVEEPVTTVEEDDGSAKSAMGKANERAERLKGEIDAYQQEVSRQADTVFDDRAARDAERAADAAKSP